VVDLEYVCTEPRPQRFELNFVCPMKLARHAFDELRAGHRSLRPCRSKWWPVTLNPSSARPGYHIVLKISSDRRPLWSF
jgi:hypothetical protein